MPNREPWQGTRCRSPHASVPQVDDSRPPRRDVTSTELVGGVERRTLRLTEHDRGWARDYVNHEVRIRRALGPTVQEVQHIGSTSVPGLAAKPIIDILLTVPDITAEEDYVEPLVAAGYELRVREPGHRMLRTPGRDVHIHVLEPADPAAADYLLFRDHLRDDATDRELYEATKRELLTREWADMNEYAEAKTAVVEDIKARARSRRTQA